MKNRTFKQMSAKAFAKAYRTGEYPSKCILDVREAEEWEQVHLKNTRLFPLSEITTNMKLLPKQSPLVLFCAHGVRSAQAASFLHSQGFQHVTSVDGGLALIEEHLAEFIHRT